MSLCSRIITKLLRIYPDSIVGTITNRRFTFYFKAAFHFIQKQYTKPARSMIPILIISGCYGAIDALKPACRRQVSDTAKIPTDEQDLQLPTAGRY